MLRVYAADWCPHCTKTIEYLKNKGVDFEYMEIENQPKSVIKKIVEVNGGKDWVVPTLEFNGNWRKGKIFNANELKTDLAELGLIINN